MNTELTFYLQHAFNLGHFFGTITGTDLATGYVATLPDLWAGDSFILQVDSFDFWSDVAADRVKSNMEGATAKLYLTFRNMGDEPTLLSTGTVTESATGEGYDRLTFGVAADAIPDSFQANQECVLYFEVTGTTTQRSAGQYLFVRGPIGNIDRMPESRDITSSIDTIDANTELTAYRGDRTVIGDTSSGNVALTAPDPDEYATQHLIIVKGAAANSLTVTPATDTTFNGVAETVTLTEVGSAVEFIPFGAGNFLMLVYRNYVR
jgi:hypothetical protein